MDRPIGTPRWRATPWTRSGMGVGAIARAIVSKPRLLLADEPTGNLDTANGDEVMDMLTQIAKDGTTVVMVTHSLTYAGYAQRTVKLLDGRVVSETLLAA
jgi:putative ABC transport system ATP-binding protein